MNRRAVLFVLLSIFPGSVAQEAKLGVNINDASTGRPTACSVELIDAKGKLVIENDSFKTGFRCPGTFTKHLPPGRTSLRITRGFETAAFSTNLDLAANREIHLTVKLQRSVDLRQRGWYGGDSHVHMLHGERTIPVNFDFVKLTAQAEDLQWLSLAQAWSLNNPTPEALEKQLTSRSTP